MPNNYSNSNKDKAKKESEKVEKKVERVTTGEVLIQKKSLGQRFKDMFVAADFRNVTNYVFYDVMIPALKNMLADGASRGVDRMLFGERAVQRGYRASHISYQSPVQRGYSSVVGRGDNLDRRGLTPQQLGTGPRYSSRHSLNTGLVLATKDEADSTIEQMGNIIEQYGTVTVGDLYNMVGLPATHVDEAWGWDDIRSAQVQQIREGYLLDLPQPQPLRG